MAFIVDENENISMVQGDSGTIIIEGLPTDKNYVVYFAIQDKNRNPIGNEISTNSNKQECVTIVLTPDFTDLLEVDKKSSYAIYYYGIKICDSNSNTEETLVTNTCDIGELNSIIVYPKKVEGI